MLGDDGQLLSPQASWNLKSINGQHCVTPAIVLPMKTGIMLWAMYLPMDTGAPTLMPKGICSKSGQASYHHAARLESYR